jgi:hypothetical protein
MSHELQNLYAIEERLRQATDKGLHIVIEHVESPWRAELAQSVEKDAKALLQNPSPAQLQPPETGTKDA